MDYERMCKDWGGAFRAEVDGRKAERLKSSLDFLGIGARPEETQGLARAVGVIGTATGLALVLALSLFIGFSLLWLLFAAFPVMLYIYLDRYPILKAGSEKRDAVGQMPEVMSYLIMSLRINPNIEKAVEFAACHSHGLFRRRLRWIISNVRAGRGDIEIGLLKLGSDFKKWDEFGRSVQLVISSTLERTEDRRQETLNKASEVLLGGLSARTEREARSLNTPVMMVFTFGVILPLVLIAIIPFMSLMGVSVGPAAVGMIYLIALPLFLYVLVRFISSNRPATIRAPQVPNEKDVKAALLVSAGVGLALLLPLLFGAGFLGPLRYAPLLWASAGGIGAFLLMTTSRTRKKQKAVKTIERGFAETLHQLGVTLSEGRPFEDAMSAVDSQFFKSAAGNVRKLNTDLRSAFFDERFGSLREIYSDTIKGVAEMLVSISSKGSDALAKVAFRTSEHINDLKKAELEIERALGGVVSSMRIIAVVVAPLVGGMISSMSVVLADTMTKSQGSGLGPAGGAQPMDPGFITLVIGAYSIISAAILTAFGTELMNGDDKVLKKHSVGLALPIVAFVFTICAWGAGLLFGGIS